MGSAAVELAEGRAGGVIRFAGLRELAFALEGAEGGTGGLAEFAVFAPAMVAEVGETALDAGDGVERIHVAELEAVLFLATVFGEDQVDFAGIGRGDEFDHAVAVGDAFGAVAIDSGGIADVATGVALKVEEAEADFAGGAETDEFMDLVGGFLLLFQAPFGNEEDVAGEENIGIFAAALS